MKTLEILQENLKFWQEQGFKKYKKWNKKVYNGFIYLENEKVAVPESFDKINFYDEYKNFNEKEILTEQGLAWIFGEEIKEDLYTTILNKINAKKGVKKIIKASFEELDAMWLKTKIKNLAGKIKTRIAKIEIEGVKK